ncbi:hypothetical protein LguiA_005794 [Lonicera macranthoides]
MAVRLLTTNMYKTHSDGSPWASVHLDHSATFETVAMELDAKEMVMKDLERFVKRREYYRKVGKAWKRGLGHAYPNETDREDLHHIHKLWVCMDLSEFGPPGDFDMVAMDLEVKEMVMKDLERFVMKGEHYRKVRKAWKRGYLLDEPLGIGKSSLIAAMANYLKFDIYDLELTDIRCNSEQRKLLV